LPNTTIHGILPMVLMNNILFGKRLCSIPFFDTGGVLADSETIENALLDKALMIAHEVKAESIDLRNSEFTAPAGNKYRGTSQKIFENKLIELDINQIKLQDKVRIIMDLPGSSEELSKSFKAKLRSQIQRPIKDGLHTKIGGHELIDQFYDVFCTNMRDLGSPVHSKNLIKNVIKHLGETVKIFVVLKGTVPVAGSVIIGFKDSIENPWASSLREYGRMSPNMLLYWSMLEYACDHGYSKFNFGRSTIGEGTYKFKLQWGGKPYSLHWQRIVLKMPSVVKVNSSKSEFEKAIAFWKKLPVSLTRIIGPMIRKHIDL
jgi:serine/alanine adding enzyme